MQIRFTGKDLHFARPRLHSAGCWSVGGWRVWLGLVGLLVSRLTRSTVRQSNVPVGGMVLRLTIVDIRLNNFDNIKDC